MRAQAHAFHFQMMSAHQFHQFSSKIAHFQWRVRLNFTNFRSPVHSTTTGSATTHPDRRSRLLQHRNDQLRRNGRRCQHTSKIRSQARSGCRRNGCRRSDTDKSQPKRLLRPTSRSATGFAVTGAREGTYETAGSARQMAKWMG